MTWETNDMEMSGYAALTRPTSLWAPTAAMTEHGPPSSNECVLSCGGTSASRRIASASMGINGGHDGAWPSIEQCVHLVLWRDALRRVRGMGTNGGPDRITTQGCGVVCARCRCLQG